MVDVSVNTNTSPIATKKGASTSTPSSSSTKIDETKKRNQVADPIRTLIESVITKTAKDSYTKETQQTILNLKSAADRHFLQEMMEHSSWRKLLIDLCATFPNSPLLTYCLKEICKRGYHREISKRIPNLSDYFDVFHGMLVSELCRLGNTAVNGNIFNYDKMLVKEVNNVEEDEEWNTDLDMLVKDLKRSCSSASYTYIYTSEVSERRYPFSN